MKDEIQQTEYFLAEIVRYIHNFISEYISDSWEVQVLIKFLIVCAAVFVLNVVFRLILVPVFRTYKNELKFPYFKSIYESKISHSIANILALLIGNYLFSAFYAGYHPDSYSFVRKLYSLIIIIAFARLGLRVMKAAEFIFAYKKNFYKIVALRAISDTVRNIGVFIIILVIISVLFGIRSTTIIGSLGAITAVLVLVFRDTILGFMSSIHVATSKNLKVGDWIGIPKYNLEGTIEEINLLTTKIQNFDKSISTVPTYDLLTTEVKNHQVMAEGNRRRIKKSIVFNANSFKFIDDTLFEKLKNINLIAEYLEERSGEIIRERNSISNSEYIINGRQLTNIGVFRRYAINYLKNDRDVDQNDVVLVRQLEITSQGMPLEIYCFANRSSMEDYEEIQADIFDHLLAASKEFDLEVMQFTKID